jgi:hypothetical protein
MNTSSRLSLPGDPETVTLRRCTLVLLVSLVIVLATLFALSLAVLLQITRCLGGAS